MIHEQHVSISKANSKMGDIRSVSLPSHLTCAASPCWETCYAHKLERIRPNVRSAYRKNLDILQKEPDKYWREVEAAVMISRFFRFHVSGDIPDASYLHSLVGVANRNPHCEILCFTKRYQLVNDLLSGGEKLPENLHLLFSVWRGFPVENRFSLPEAHVLYRDGTTTARADAVSCSNNCSECAVTNSGCWTLECGQQVVFHEH